MIPDPAELVRLAGEHIERVLIKERQKELLATYLLFSLRDDKPQLHVVPCLWHNEIEKQAMLLLVRRIAREQNARALSFVSEAWMAARSADKPRLDLPPSEDPQRREMVFALATDGKTKAARRWQIVRNRPGGRIISLVDDGALGDADKFEGRIIDGILP